MTRAGYKALPAENGVKSEASRKLLLPSMPCAYAPRSGARGAIRKVPPALLTSGLSLRCRERA